MSSNEINIENRRLEYNDELTNRRMYILSFLCSRKKLELFLHPFKTVKLKRELRKLDAIEEIGSNLEHGVIEGTVSESELANFFDNNPVLKKKSNNSVF